MDFAFYLTNCLDKEEQLERAARAALQPLHRQPTPAVHSRLGVPSSYRKMPTFTKLPSQTGERGAGLRLSAPRGGSLGPTGPGHGAAAALTPPGAPARLHRPATPAPHAAPAPSLHGDVPGAPYRYGIGRVAGPGQLLAPHHGLGLILLLLVLLLQLVDRVEVRHIGQQDAHRRPSRRACAARAGGGAAPRPRRREGGAQAQRGPAGALRGARPGPHGAAAGARLPASPRARAPLKRWGAACGRGWWRPLRCAPARLPLQGGR